MRNLDWRRSCPYAQSMDVHLSADLEAQVKEWAAGTGRTPDELVEDAIAGYLTKLARVRETLDSRYDEIKSGKIQLLDGEEVFAQLLRKSEERRTNRS